MYKSRCRSLLAMTLVALATGCDANSDCTEIGCTSRVSVSAAPGSGIWQAGNYGLDVSLDGEAVHCEFLLPDALPAEGLDSLIDCGDVVRASFVSRDDCSGGCSLTDEYDLQLLFFKLPEKVDVKLTRDGESVLDESRAIEYHEVFPNGPECGGTCQQAK